MKQISKLALITILSLSGYALSGMPSQADLIPYHPRVNEVNSRVQYQHDRIAQGVNSGSLTLSQAGRLSDAEAGLKNEEHNMRENDWGHLTPRDQAALNQRQNFISRNIYVAKH